MASIPPTWIMLITKSAPASASRRSSVATISADASEARGQLLRGAASNLESLGIDVVEHDAQRREVVETEQVGEQLAREHDAARAEENDLRHGDIVR